MDIPNTNEIRLYFHCGNCLPLKPADVTPLEWCRVQAGWTQLGLQAWCHRCEMNVVHIDFEGQKHPANLSARRMRLPDA